MNSKVICQARAGDVIFVECDIDLTAKQLGEVYKSFEPVVSKFGIGVIVLNKNFKVARVQNGQE